MHAPQTPSNTGNFRLRGMQWAALLVLSAASLFTGVTELSPLALLGSVPEQVKILFISRFPRLLSIVITGASLAIAGLIMQSITRNRFVSPTTAGTMEWCRLGVMIAIFFSPTPLPCSACCRPLLFPCSARPCSFLSSTESNPAALSLCLWRA